MYTYMYIVCISAECMQYECTCIYMEVWDARSRGFESHLRQLIFPGKREDGLSQVLLRCLLFDHPSTLY